MGDMDLPSKCHLNAGNTILSCTQADWDFFRGYVVYVVHLNRSGSMLEKVSSDTVYSLGFGFYFFNRIFLLFSLSVLLSFFLLSLLLLFLIFSFSFLAASFFAVFLFYSFYYFKVFITGHPE